MMAALMLLISVALLLLKFNVFAFSVMTEIFISAFLMVVGQIENYRSGEDDEY